MITITNNELNKTEQHTRDLIEGVIAEATYEAATPIMIGDFTGESYKLIKQPGRGYIGAYITGLPTPKQIIGEARWLMRVALATVTGARTHREAEEAAPVTIHEGRKTRKLGAVELALGSSGRKMKGLLTVQVQLYNKLYHTSSTIHTDPRNAIVEYRTKIIDNRFIKYNNAWYAKNNKYRTKVYNRFNSILAMGSEIHTKNNMKYFIPTKRDEKSKIKYYNLVEPIDKEKYSFTIKILLDKPRYNHILDHTNDKETVDAALRLAVLSILATPVLKGLGKGTNRGFGHFKPTYIKIKDPNYNIKLGTLLDPIRLIEELASKAKTLAGVDKPRGTNTHSILEGSIPRLPVDKLKKEFINTIKLDPRINEFTVLNIIGLAAMKNTWKQYCKESSASGRYYHTWPLGLPRSSIIEGSDTGYILRGDNDRRQSFISAFTLGDGKIYVIGYPSGDLINIIPDRLIYVGKNRILVTKLIKKCIKKLEECNCKKTTSATIKNNEDNILKITFNNYNHVLRWKSRV